MTSLPKPTQTQRLTAQAREVLPRHLEDFGLADQDSVQTSIWLVGLSAGAIAALLAKPETFQRFERGPLLVAGLLAVIVLGVLHRFIHQMALRIEAEVNARADVSLWALLQEDAVAPPEAQDAWPIEQLAHNLETHFGRPMRGLSTPAAARRVYEQLRLEWHVKESARAAVLHNLTRAIEGNDPLTTEEAAKARAQEPPADPYADLRLNAKRARRMRLEAATLYGVVLGGFAMTCVLAGVELLRTAKVVPPSPAAAAPRTASADTANHPPVRSR